MYALDNACLTLMGLDVSSHWGFVIIDFVCACACGCWFCCLFFVLVVGFLFFLWVFWGFFFGGVSLFFVAVVVLGG